ncbi:MAG: ankyrin repeat domain-containing protein, partial [Myxococcota bacterium]
LQVGVMVQVSPSIGLTSVSDAGAGSSTWPYDEVRSVALAGYRPSPHARVAFTWPTSFRYANRIVTAAAIDGTRATLWIRTPTADAEPPVGSTAEALWVLAQPVLTWGEPGSDPAPLARSLRAERDRRGCDWRALAGGYLVDWSLTEPTEPAPDFDGANRDRADRITAGDWPTWRLELEVADPAWLAHLTGAPFPIERRSVPAAVPWEDPLLRWTEAPSATSTPTIASAEPEPPPMRTFAGPVTRGWAQLDPADPRTVIRDAGLRDDPAATRDLVQACKSGWVEVVRAYIALGANLDAAEPDTGTPPLVAAAEGDHPEVIRALVAGGAGLEVRDRSDDTAAMTAVNWHHPNALAALFALGADPSAANAYGQSSLTKVLEAPDPDLLAALLAAGADVNLGGERGQSALDKAAQSGDRALLRQLLDAGGDPGLTDAVGRPLLARVSDPELARLLLDAGAPIDGPPGGLAPIDAATIEGRDAVVALLASRGARAPDAVRIAAIRAVRDGDVAGVREALAAGADPNGPELERGSLLHRAVERGAQEVVDALLAAGADPNRLDEFGRPATAHCDDPAFGRWLCARGLAVNGTQSGWRTPLLGLALDKADAELLDAVIAAGAELRDLGWLHSPLVWGDYPDAWVVTVLERLAAAGADLEARYSIGEITLLCGFASRRRLAAVDALVALGADVEATNAQQQTALYLACGVGGSEEDAVAVLDRLVAAGARTDRVDWLRQSAYESAANYRRDGVRAWFEARFEATLGVGEPVWSEVAARTDDASFLHWVRTRRLDVVRGLLSAGYAPDPVQPTFESPLSVAATAGDLELVELLLAHGADPNWALPYDGRALTHATGAGQLEVVRALLAAGADLEARGFDHGPVYGVTDLALLELLLAAGASPEPRPAGWAPLHHAARVGAFEAADRLVAAGVHLDVRAPGRVTPLHLALDNDRIELGCALIAAGA